MGVGGWGELYPSLFWIFGIVFNYAKPLSARMYVDVVNCINLIRVQFVNVLHYLSKV